MRSSRAQGARVVVIDDRRLIREAIAGSLAGCGLDTQALAADAIDDLDTGEGVVLLSLGTASRGNHVAALAMRGWRVVVYGPWDETRVAAAVADGALGFVPGAGGVEDVAAQCRGLLRGRGGFTAEERARLAAHALRVRRAETHRVGGLAALTPREREVLSGLVDGRRAAEIAADSYVSVTTVRNQVQSILAKLDVHSQLEAVAAARKHGWEWGSERSMAGFDVSAS
jgi:DNA-binding NarL/FixJ family response regulator